MKVVHKPHAWEIESVQYTVSQLESLEEILKQMDGEHFGPDFAKACEMVYATRRYLEIELTQYVGDPS